MAENTKEEEQPVAKAPEGPSKLIPMLLVANTVLMGAVLAVVLLRKPSPAAAVVVSAAKTSSSNSTATGEGAGKEGSKEEGSGHGENAGHGEATPPVDPNGAPGPILKLENFIIQLRGTDTDRYVRVAFDLELGAESDRAMVQARMPHIRDAIISYFSDRSLDELRGSEGMDHIKLAVSKRLDDILAAHRVKSVFITELVIQ
ncbi:MAG TPA: flagellar basal body-associated FliL family protein [Polyangia bacterium]